MAMQVSLASQSSLTMTLKYVELSSCKSKWMNHVLSCVYESITQIPIHMDFFLIGSMNSMDKEESVR